MDKKQSRDPKDQIAFLKEWVSDNLRYILLAAAIVIIVLIIIFALSSSPIEKADNTKSAQTSTVSETSSVSENGIATDDKSSAGQTDKSASSAADSSAASNSDDKSDVPADSSSSASSQEDTKADTNEGTQNETSDVSGAETPAGGQLVVASPEVSAAVETYLTALAASDVDSAASVSENLTQEEIAAIAGGVYPSPIERIVVYSYPGTEEGSYIAIARFDATTRDTQVSVPACSAYYLITADTGAVLIASLDTTAAHQAELDEVIAYPAVAQLIADVANAAQAVLAAAAQ